MNEDNSGRGEREEEGGREGCREGGREGCREVGWGDGEREGVVVGKEEEGEGREGAEKEEE